MKEIFIHRGDIRIERMGGYASVYESEGNKVFDFPYDFTDEMIYKSFELADFAYNCGLRDGRIQKEIQIREAVELLSSLGVKVKE